jgi:hypothetical protein
MVLGYVESVMFILRSQVVNVFCSDVKAYCKAGKCYWVV